MRGGYGSSDHGTLADRVARQSGAEQVPPAGPAAPPAGSVAAAPGAPGAGPVQVSPARHCRVAGEPSLLVEWCRTERGWEGRVVSVVWLDAVGWATVARWLPSGDIEPVG